MTVEAMLPFTKLDRSMVVVCGHRFVSQVQVHHITTHGITTRATVRVILLQAQSHSSESQLSIITIVHVAYHLRCILLRNPAVTTLPGAYPRVGLSSTVHNRVSIIAIVFVSLCLILQHARRVQVHINNGTSPSRRLC